MKCPFSGKPCLLPKEIFVTEIHEGQLKNLFLCNQCGEDYIDKLNNAEMYTTALEVKSDAEGVSHTERLIEDKSQQKAIEEQPSEEKLHPSPKPLALIKQIRQLKRKMEHAIDEERYEDAATLKEVLEDLKDQLESIKPKSEDSDQDSSS